MASTADAKTAYENAVREIEFVRRSGQTMLNLAGAYEALDRLPEEIATIPNLEILNLNRSGVSDIGPARHLLRLRSITLDHTQVNDLRPLRDLPLLWAGNSGLSFDQTPAASNDPQLGRLKRIADPKTRDSEMQAI